MKANGYNGTSVKDIVDAAGVPKGSFYNYFESKEMFAAEALDHVAGCNMAEMRKTLANRHHTPTERLATFFNSAVGGCCEGEFKVGCFLGNMCQEMADNSELIRGKVRRLLQQQTGLIQQTLEEGKELGELSQGLDTQSTAEFLINAWQGAQLRMKAAQSREPLDAFLKQFRILLNIAPKQAHSRA